VIDKVEQVRVGGVDNRLQTHAGRFLHLHAAEQHFAAPCAGDLAWVNSLSAAWLSTSYQASPSGTGMATSTKGHLVANLGSMGAERDYAQGMALNLFLVFVEVAGSIGKPRPEANSMFVLCGFAGWNPNGAFASLQPMKLL
jgi:hypothetical protein